MVKKLSFRIRRSYFDAIVKEKKRDEYRRYIPYWLIRIDCPEGLPIGYRWRTEPGEFEAVFICGKRIHRREIIAISRIHTPYGFSAQGKKDVNTETCIDFELGKEIPGSKQGRSSELQLHNGQLEASVLGKIQEP